MITLNNAYAYAIKKIEHNVSLLGASFPHVTICEDNTKYNDEKPQFWTGGFWGGLLWLLYNETQDIKALETAIEIETKQDELFDEFLSLHHDVGFMWLPTAVEHYKKTGCKKSFVRGLKAASVLASRFNLNGRFIRAWNNYIREDSEGWAIIDCMMNLSLLYWASKETKDPRFKQIATAHADTVLKSFVRPNFTVPHIVEFDPITGERLRTGAGQGKSPTSSWSRGQAWAIYGFAISYRETGKKEYFDASLNIARKFYSSLPEDKVPYWDFDSETEDRFVRDSSAAAIAASGMLELALLVEDEKVKSEVYNMGKSLLQALTDNYAIFDDSCEGLLKNGTVNYARKKHVNVSIIYGDFYYLEALAKLQGKVSIF